MTLKEWALVYCDAGLSIVPLIPKTKIPHHELLKEAGFCKRNGEATWIPLTTGKAPRALVELWWTKCPDANIALVCGEISGITVIDIDYHPERDPNAIDPYKLYMEAFPITMTSKTGGGGLHVFCKYNPSIPNSNGKLHRQIDTKNDCGLVTLPPSVHENGNTYAFDSLFPFSKDALSNLADIPKTVVDWFDGQKMDRVSSDEWLHIWGGLKETVDGRDDGGTRLIGKFLNGLWYEFKKDPVFIPMLWEIMMYWNTKNDPPMSEAQMQKIFKSIVSKYL